jgi:hypothetical protein
VKRDFVPPRSDTAMPAGTGGDQVAASSSRDTVQPQDPAAEHVDDERDVHRTRPASTRRRPTRVRCQAASDGRWLLVGSGQAASSSHSSSCLQAPPPVVPRHLVREVAQAALWWSPAARRRSSSSRAPGDLVRHREGPPVAGVAEALVAHPAGRRRASVPARLPGRRARCRRTRAGRQRSRSRFGSARRPRRGSARPGRNPARGPSCSTGVPGGAGRTRFAIASSRLGDRRVHRGEDPDQADHGQARAPPPPRPAGGSPGARRSARICWTRASSLRRRQRCSRATILRAVVFDRPGVLAAADRPRRPMFCGCSWSV